MGKRRDRRGKRRMRLELKKAVETFSWLNNVGLILLGIVFIIILAGILL